MNVHNVPGGASRYASGTGKILARRILVTLVGRPGAKRASRKQPPNKGIERILVIRPDNLGDLLFATPTLQRLREAFPGAHITGLVGPWGRSMWEGNPNLDALETLPFPGIVGRSEGRPLAPYLMLRGAARKLARERYGLAVVLRFDHWWGAALVWAAGIPHVWGYSTPGTRAWLTNAAPYVPGRHEVEQDLRLGEAVIEAFAGRGNAQRPDPLYISRERGEPPLRPPGPVPCEGVPAGWLNAPRRAIIHPGTGAANKLWTIQGWAQVADRLSQAGWAVALTGTPGERPLAEAIAVASESNPLNLAGQTANLGQLAWLFSRADMALGVDSGPLHIAAALDKPTLHLYGPSDEAIWGPWGDPTRHRTLRAPGTHPTMRLEVTSHALEGGPEMRAITPPMVIEQINKLLQTTGDNH